MLDRPRQLAVLVPLVLLTAGLAMIDLLDGRLAIGEIGRVAAGILVFAIAAIAGWTLTGRMR